jgi:hypothetical protein
VADCIKIASVVCADNGSEKSVATQSVAKLATLDADNLQIPKVQIMFLFIQLLLCSPRPADSGTGSFWARLRPVYRTRSVHNGINNQFVLSQTANVQIYCNWLQRLA